VELLRAPAAFDGPCGDHGVAVCDHDGVRQIDHWANVGGNKRHAVAGRRRSTSAPRT
jgi:hypothetical protein